MKAPKKILVIKFRNIGDVLLTLPLISTLKLGVEGSKIYLAVKPGTEDLLKDHPHLDGIFVLPTKRSNQSRLAHLKKYLNWLLRLRRMKFDLAINTTEGDRGILLSLFIGADEKWGEIKTKKIKSWRGYVLDKHFINEESIQHMVQRNLAFSGTLTDHLNSSIYIHIDTKTSRETKKKLSLQGYDQKKPLIHIHPTSRWLFKCWSDQKMATVIDSLIQNGFQIALTSGPSQTEMERIKRILSHCNEEPIVLAGQVTLKETAEISRISCLFFGVDTAPMHMAAAVGTPVLALFGPSFAKHWGPWPNDFSLTSSPYPRDGGTQKYSPHQIIQKNWPCIPCGKDGCEGSKKSACLDCISPDEVLEEIYKKELKK